MSEKKRFVKFLKIPTCAAGAKYDILFTVPQKWAQGRSCGASEQIANLTVRRDAVILDFPYCGDFYPAGRSLTSNGVEAEMKSKNKSGRRVVITLDAITHNQYITLSRIVSKHCGAVSLSRIFAPLMPSAGFAAGCVASDWFGNDGAARRSFLADLDAAGVVVE